MKRGNIVDRTGVRYGRLQVKAIAGRSNDGHVLWQCLCDCGTLCLVQSNNFRAGAKKGTQSCGCLRSEVSSQPKASWNKGATYQIHADEKAYKNRKAWAAAVRRARGNSCERCGWGAAQCDVHHRVKRSEGGLNTVANGEVICPNCHRIEHGGRA
jgi:hypothetical protein